MTTNIRIDPVLTRGDRKEFVDLPYSLYRDNPVWIPPLRMDQRQLIDPDKNAFFEHGTVQPFVARNSDGEVVGRVAAVINGMHLKKYDDDTGFFGFFESVKDYDVAQALLDTAVDWLRDQGMTSVRGPTNPSLNDTAGLLVEGFDQEPAILMPYNPPYYEDFLSRYGFEKVQGMWAYYIHQKYLDLSRLQRGVSLVRKRYPSLEVRTLDMDNFDEEADIIRDIYNDAWSDNWGHVPITEREFDQLAKELKQIVDPRIVMMLELDGEPVAFSVTLPDLNRVLRFVHDGRLFPTGLLKILLYTSLFQVRTSRMALLGVRKEYQGKGLDGVMILETIERGVPIGYNSCELSWVLEDNQPMKKAIENIGAVLDKKYILMERDIT